MARQKQATGNPTHWPVCQPLILSTAVNSYFPHFICSWNTVFVLWWQTPPKRSPILKRHGLQFLHLRWCWIGQACDMTLHRGHNVKAGMTSSYQLSTHGGPGSVSSVFHILLNRLILSPELFTIAQCLDKISSPNVRFSQVVSLTQLPWMMNILMPILLRGKQSPSHLFWSSLHFSRLRLRIQRPGAVAHDCNPSILGGQVEWITWDQEFETSLADVAKLHLYFKNPLIGQAWWLRPVIPALWEAEAGIMRSWVRDQSGQNGETQYLLKIQKLAGWGGRSL